jgi:hypothetical protein
MEPLCPTFNFKNIKKNHSLGTREGGTDFEHLDCFQREEMLVMPFSSVFFPPAEIQVGIN